MSDIILQGVSLDDLTANVTTAVVEQLRLLIAESSSPILVDTDEMARLAGMSRNTIDRLRKNGTIPSVKVNARRMYDPVDVIAALKANGNGGGNHE